MANDSWQYQGRQHHQWFGHGTKPQEDRSAPSSLDERIRALGMTAIAALRPDGRRRPAASFDASLLNRLATVLQVLVRSRGEPADKVAENLLGTDAASPVASHLRRATELVADATTSSGMRDAADALADGMRAAGLYRWRTQLNDMAAHVELVANADDPRGNDSVRYIAKSLGMSATQRQMLHRRISKENLPSNTKRDIAREITQDYPNNGWPTEPI